MRTLGEWMLYLAFFAIMFVVIQFATCWTLWHMQNNSGITPKESPAECTIETIAGHFQR